MYVPRTCAKHESSPPVRGRAQTVNRFSMFNEDWSDFVGEQAALRFFWIHMPKTWWDHILKSLNNPLLWKWLMINVRTYKLYLQLPKLLVKEQFLEIPKCVTRDILINFVDRGRMYLIRRRMKISPGIRDVWCQNYALVSVTIVFQKINRSCWNIYT